MEKKTLIELYEESKKEQEKEQQLGNLMVIAEMFKSQLAPDLCGYKRTERISAFDSIMSAVYGAGPLPVGLDKETYSESTTK